MFEPTVKLRFVDRDGQRILQQLWVNPPDPGDFLGGLIKGGMDALEGMTKEEWRDIPMVKDPPEQEDTL